MTYITWIGVALVTTIGIFGLVHVASGAGRNQPAQRTHKVPDAGWVTMPGRFIADNGATRLVPMEVLMTYGKRSWNIGGYQQIAEAIAVGSKEKFADRQEFRMLAAHYLQDANWRGPAREQLDWQRVENKGLLMHIAELQKSPGRRVILAEREGVPVYAAAFVQGKYLDRAIEALSMTFTNYSKEPIMPTSEQ